MSFWEDTCLWRKTLGGGWRGVSRSTFSAILACKPINNLVEFVLLIRKGITVSAPVQTSAQELRDELQKQSRSQLSMRDYSFLQNP